MNVRLFVYLFLFFFVLQSKAQATSNKEIENLIQKGDFKGILEKAESVDPSERNDKWTAHVARATLERMKELLGERNPSEVLKTSAVALEKYPAIRDHKMFLPERSVVGLKAFEQCLKNKNKIEDCNLQFQDFVAQDLNNTNLAFQAGILVSKAISMIAGIPYFYMSLKTKAEKTQCQNPKVKKALANAMGADAAASEVSMAKEILFKKCWGNYDQKYIGELIDSEKKMKNSCEGLLEKQALSGEKKQSCEEIIKKEI
ncbi:MAG: hypothetical protein AB7O96_04065 [Pseudobdellovibrionaceae bacterium]